MDVKKLVGYGAAIWAIMFVLISALVGFKLSDAAWVGYVTVVLSGVLAYVFAGMVDLKDLKSALTYGIGWVVVGLILDFVISARFAADIFSSWNLWAGYALVLLVPAVRTQIAQKA
ncbi:MAG: hypothetical protein M1355_02890 [Patescibacteria group bacterium]|nr:hypothetical protein [Patescibacteria group bacterium]